MPFPIAEVIGAGATVGVAGANIYSQGRTNRKGRIQNQYFFDRQRENALADWHMQNAYNSPAAVKQRLKDAHLNPALVYGQGSTGSNASPVKETEYRDTTQQAPQIDPGIIGKAVDIYNASLQRSILQQNLANEKERQFLLKAQTSDALASAAGKGTSAERAAIELDTYKRLTADDIPYLKGLADYQNVSTEAVIKHTQMEAQEEFIKLSQAEQRARINEIEQRIKNMGQEYRLKSFKEGLVQQGINPDAGPMTDYWQQLRLFFERLKDKK